MNQDLNYLFRTTQLAQLGDSRTLDSPHVGSILVAGSTIIGEGYHKQAGDAHAEVNCLASVRPEDRHLIPVSVLYVSLEPCCIVGKTGACSTLILNHRIKTVVIGQRDSTPGVDGGSVELLRAAGVEVREYPDFLPTLAPYQYRHTLVTEQRPYITLKYAQSSDGFLRPADREVDYWITGPISRRLVHRWRTDQTGILVGGKTVVEDNPRLDSRYFPGPAPRPIILDPRGRVTGRERVFSGEVAPLLFTSRPDVNPDSGEVIAIPPSLDKATLGKVLKALAARRLASVTVEGGAAILRAFLESGCWEEAKVFTGAGVLKRGLPAPRLSDHSTSILVEERTIGKDRLTSWVNG